MESIQSTNADTEFKGTTLSVGNDFRQKTKNEKLKCGFLRTMRYDWPFAWNQVDALLKFKGYK